MRVLAPIVVVMLPLTSIVSMVRRTGALLSELMRLGDDGVT